MRRNIIFGETLKRVAHPGCTKINRFTPEAAGFVSYLKKRSDAASKLDAASLAGQSPPVLTTGCGRFDNTQTRM